MVMAGNYYPMDLFFDNPAYGIIVSLIMNAVYFAIIGYIIIGDPIRKSTIQRFMTGIAAMTTAAIVAGFIPFLAFGIEVTASYAPHFMVNYVIMAAATFLISRFYFRASVKSSTAAAMIMAVLANYYLIWIIF